jgi:hypothetical protein
VGRNGVELGESCKRSPAMCPQVWPVQGLRTRCRAPGAARQALPLKPPAGAAPAS